MKSVIWYYPKEKLSRKEAEDKIYKIGFKDASKGWQKSLGTTRLHIIPSDGYMSIHRDNDLHTLMGGTKTRKILMEVLAQLQDNKRELFIYRIERIVKEFKNFLNRI